MHVGPEFYMCAAGMLFLALIMSKGAEKIGQTPMVGRMTVGIIFGLLIGYLSKFAINPYTPEVAAIIGVLSAIGLTIFQANCGLEIDFGKMKNGGARTMFFVLVAGFICPIILGSALGVYLAPQYKPESVPLGVFCAMCGLFLTLTSIVAISLTLGPMGLKKTNEASICLTAATFEDVIAWIAVAIVMLFMPHAEGAGGHASHSPTEMIVGSLIILGIAFGIVRPLLRKYLPRKDTPNLYVVYFGGLCFFAALTDFIGMHALIGAMLWGGIIPRDLKVKKHTVHDSHSTIEHHPREESVAHLLERRLERFIQPFFVTIFLVRSGMQCEWTMGPQDMLNGVLIVAVAIVSKLGACALAARYSSWDKTQQKWNVSWRSALTIGTCMNCRGLMTLMLLSVARDAGIIDGRLFSLMLVQALFTTAMTSWGLHLIGAKELVTTNEFNEVENGNGVTEEAPATVALKSLKTA